jgi:hypothetical protein
VVVVSGVLGVGLQPGECSPRASEYTAPTGARALLDRSQRREAAVGEPGELRPRDAGRLARGA